MLLKAFEALHERHPNRYHLVIVGDGPAAPHPPRHPPTHQRPHPGAPHLQDSARLAEYYHAADLFIHPGVCETFGLVVLEAQACGLPCVGVKGSFMDANIMVGLNLWATRNDPHDIADAIERYEEQDLPRPRRASRKTSPRPASPWDKVFQRQWALYTKARLHGAPAPPQ